MPELRQSFALQATFKADKSDSATIAAKMDVSKNKRKSSQPIAASAGCVFKNPSEIPAGKLVDELGMKEQSIGKAQVSLEHGNFIVNRGKATATEILSLIDLIRQKAKDERGIIMETEVQILGEDEFTF